MVVMSQVMFTCCCAEGIKVNNVQPLNLDVRLLYWMSDYVSGMYLYGAIFKGK